MENEFITTDVGLLSRDNANWLFKQNVISPEGSIRHLLVNGMTEKKVQLYSYLRWCVDQAKERIPAAPKQVHIGMNEMVELLRTGSLDIPYDDHRYLATHPRVSSIYDSGRKAYVEKRPADKKGVDFSVLD